MSKHIFDSESWAKQDIFFQLGNIGSEVGRAVKAKKENKKDSMYSAFYRGMDLINATINAWVEKGKSPYELLIAREQFAQTILTDVIDQKIEDYFMQFAVAFRIRGSLNES